MFTIIWDINIGGAPGVRLFFNNGAGDHEIKAMGTTEWRFITGAGRSLWFLKDDMSFFSSAGRDKPVVSLWNTSTTQNTLGIGRDRYAFMNAAGYAQLDQKSGSLIISANNDNSNIGKQQLTIYGNNNNVGIGTTPPVASAKLEVNSTSQGFLPPRMTANQASAIPSPAEGLILYVTDTNGTFATKGWYGFDGATWNKLN